VYPNPAGETVKVTYNERGNAAVEIRITDVTGKVLQTISVQKRGFTIEQEIDLKALATGIYFLQISSSEGQIVRPFVKE
jgi:predicted DNA binding protein